jgi:hypothetical protein
VDNYPVSVDNFIVRSEKDIRCVLPKYVCVIESIIKGHYLPEIGQFCPTLAYILPQNEVFSPHFGLFMGRNAKNPHFGLKKT